MIVNSQAIAIKQFFAFLIDLFLVSTFLVVSPTIEAFFWFSIIWYLYIPLAEIYYGQTIGMKIMGTKIFLSSDIEKNIGYKIAFRRHISRISIIWAPLGWMFLFAGNQLIKDYVIIYKQYTSFDLNEIENAISTNQDITNDKV